MEAFQEAELLDCRPGGRCRGREQAAEQPSLPVWPAGCQPGSLMEALGVGQAGGRQTVRSWGGGHASLQVLCGDLRGAPSGRGIGGHEPALGTGRCSEHCGGHRWSPGMGETSEPGRSWLSSRGAVLPAPAEQTVFSDVRPPSWAPLCTTACRCPPRIASDPQNSRRDRGLLCAPHPTLPTVTAHLTPCRD